MTDEEVFTFNRVRRKASRNPHFHVFVFEYREYETENALF